MTERSRHTCHWPVAGSRGRAAILGLQDPLVHAPETDPQRHLAPLSQRPRDHQGPLARVRRRSTPGARMDLRPSSRRRALRPGRSIAAVAGEPAGASCAGFMRLAHSTGGDVAGCTEVTRQLAIACVGLSLKHGWPVVLDSMLSAHYTLALGKVGPARLAEVLTDSPTKRCGGSNELRGHATQSQAQPAAPLAAASQARHAR
jgi:hypothetical protein